MRTTSSRSVWTEARAALRWALASLWRPADADSGWQQAPGHEPPLATGGHHAGAEQGAAEPSTTRGTAQSH
ncbi:MAG TPA: hypothetical protein VFD32_14260 [Dehalococcoidia bacterium]|nr:hypothetical protein [Dehalococcoidia bacterium]